MKNGEWIEPSEKERIEEIRALINGLNNPITVNTLTSTSAVQFVAELSKDREEILHDLDQVIEGFNNDQEQYLHNWRHQMRYVQ